MSAAAGLPVSVRVVGFHVGASPVAALHPPGRGVVSQRLKPSTNPSSAAETGAPAASVPLTVARSASMSPSANAQPSGGVGVSKTYVVVDGVVAVSASGRRLR